MIGNTGCWLRWLLVDWRCPVNYSKQETTLAKTEVRHQACSQSLSTLMLTFHVFFSQNCFSQHNSRYFDLLLEMKRKNTASSSDFNLILDISTFISKWKSEKSPSCNNFFLQWDVKFFFPWNLMCHCVWTFLWCCVTMVVQHFCLYCREENAGQRLLQYSCSLPT